MAGRFPPPPDSLLRGSSLVTLGFTSFPVPQPCMSVGGVGVGGASLAVTRRSSGAQCWVLGMPAGRVSLLGRSSGLSGGGASGTCRRAASPMLCAPLSSASGSDGPVPVSSVDPVRGLYVGDREALPPLEYPDHPAKLKGPHKPVIVKGALRRFLGQDVTRHRGGRRCSNKATRGARGSQGVASGRRRAARSRGGATLAGGEPHPRPGRHTDGGSPRPRKGTTPAGGRHGSRATRKANHRGSPRRRGATRRKGGVREGRDASGQSGWSPRSKKRRRWEDVAVSSRHQ